MITIIVFLAGFYMGIIVFSLLVMARRNASNQPLTKLSISHYLRRVEPMIEPHGTRSINHGLRDAENML